MRPGPTRRLLAILAARTNIPEQFHHDGIVLISLHKVQDGFRIRELSAKDVDTLGVELVGHLGEVDKLQSSGSDVGHILNGEGEVLDELAHLVLQLLHLVPLSQVENLIQLDQVLLLELNFLLIVEAQEVLKSLPCCVFDHHHIFHVLLEKSSGAKEDVLEVVTVEGDDDLVSLEGGDHLVLLVDHIELDVARDGGGGAQQAGEVRPVKVECLTITCHREQ